ncbi:ribosomal protein S18-alanine N-acetyltransferase [Magnetococcales bacterium HHB-1]
MDNRFSLRAMKPEDAPVLKALHQVLFARSWSDDDFVQACVREDQLAVVLCYGHHCVGYGVAQHMVDEWHLLTLAVEKTHQGLGGGGALLQWINERIQKQDQETSLLLEVRQDNQIAIALYQQMGFQVIGCRKGYYADQGLRVDALVMRQRIEGEN